MLLTKRSLHRRRANLLFHPILKDGQFLIPTTLMLHRNVSAGRPVEMLLLLPLLIKSFSTSTEKSYRL
jgi:hypothetical protein